MHHSGSISKAIATKGIVALIIAVACAMAVMVVQAAPQTAHADGATQKVYRLYNQWNFKHHYTTDASERANLLAAGYQSEGVGWMAPTNTGTPVYRLYNPYTTEHLYTTDKAEYDSLSTNGWNGEGPKLNSDDAEGVVVYRLFNPYADPSSPNTHIYTTDIEEYNTLINAGCSDDHQGFFAVDQPIDNDLFLGSFFVDTPGQGSGFENVLCVSTDGYSFTKVTTPFSNSLNPFENPFHDPSIMYKDGYFYMLSNMPTSVCDNRNTGHYLPMISYSKDLITWTQPEGWGLINNGNYDGIPLATLPFGMGEFDVVGSEWFRDDNGDTYMLFSAGYYGANHGQAENDRMKLYAVKVNLSHNGFTPWLSDTGKPFPQDLTLSFSQAYEIQGLEGSDNYIDPSVYKVGGKYYLIIKKDGVNNQIYENTSMGPTGWKRVNDSIAIGNEGPSMVNSDGAYLLYTDQIATFHGHDGIQVSAATAPWNAFSAPIDVTCKDRWNSNVHLRHGTVLKLDGAARTTAEAFMAANGIS